MSKITEFARDKHCTARISGICNHNPETSVWAHIESIRWGAGRGIKVPDVCGLIACSACHDALDGRVPSNFHREEISTFAYEGHMESLALLVKEGIL